MRNCLCRYSRLRWWLPSHRPPTFNVVRAWFSVVCVLRTETHILSQHWLVGGRGTPKQFNPNIECLPLREWKLQDQQKVISVYLSYVWYILTQSVHLELLRPSFLLTSTLPTFPDECIECFQWWTFELAYNLPYFALQVPQALSTVFVVKFPPL